MKIYLLAILLFLFTFNSSINNLYAQESDKKTKAINGFFINMNIGLFSDNIEETPYSIQAGPGWTLGFKSLKRINHKFSRSFELIYITKGGRFETTNSKFQTYDIQSGNTEVAKLYRAYGLRYFSTPYLIYWHPNGYIDHKSELIKSNVKMGFGIAPAYNIGSNVYYNYFVADTPPAGGLITTVGATEHQVKRSFSQANKFALNLIYDLMFNIRHGNASTMFIDIRYEFMLTDPYNNNVNPTNHHNFSFGLGWLY